MRKAFLLFCSFLFSATIIAQSYELKSTGEIYSDLQKLHKGMRVLYLAAHPDDENTRLISWLENSENIETAYLSLTRGQGGQNLIGDEKGDGLGVIRTYELLEARKIDGGEQFFTRAVDFGYSKSAEESFEKWGEQEVLADVVYVIRKFRPHIIVTRFPPTRAAGHGHHEASAILAEKAFEMAADSKAFPKQLKQVQPWKVTALYHNASSWWDKSLDDLTEAQLEEKQLHRMDVGVFNEVKGLGINEIASLARSKHRCQAFGTMRDRGERIEYLRLVKGDWKPSFPDDYSGMWELSPAHQGALQKVIDGFDFTDRAKNIALLEEHFASKIAQRNVWAKGNDMAQIIKAYQQILNDLTGVRVEASAPKDPVIFGDSYPVDFEAYNSSAQSVELRFSEVYGDTAFTLEAGKRVNWTRFFQSPNDVSNPYWLREPHTDLYSVIDPALFGLPFLEDERVEYSVRSGQNVIKASTVLHRKWNDRSYGEFTEPMAFVPYAHLNPERPSLIVPVGQKAEVKLLVKASKGITKQTLRAIVPSGWTIDVKEVMVTLSAGQAKEFSFMIQAEAGAEPATLGFKLKGENESVGHSAEWIRYDHIPEIVIHRLSTVKLVPVNLPAVSGRVLYIDGSGDEVDEALDLMGYEVDKRSLSGLTLEQLKSYKAVVLGIRSLNRNEELASYYSLLLDYAANGGNLIVQYNTTYDLKVKDFGPYPISLSRKRVTEEGAEAKILVAEHPVFNAPNKIGSADFDGWVQERGLYFAGEWDAKYTPLIAWHDKGEEDVKGGLLVASTGSGSFFYTGISFFRELPAGVPGAYRLLMNMIEYQN